MSSTIDQSRILAFAVHELRLLLAGHLGFEHSDDPAISTAAHLAYALHNQAAAVLEGRSFDPAQAIQAIARVDERFGTNLVLQLQRAADQENRS